MKDIVEDTIIDRITVDQAKSLLFDLDEYEMQIWQNIAMNLRQDNSCDVMDKDRIKEDTTAMLAEIRRRVEVIISHNKLGDALPNNEYEDFMVFYNNYKNKMDDIKVYVKERAKYENDENTTDLTNKNNCILFTYKLEDKIRIYHREAETDERTQTHALNMDYTHNIRRDLINNDISLKEFKDSVDLLERLYEMNGKSNIDENGVRITFSDIEKERKGIDFKDEYLKRLNLKSGNSIKLSNVLLWTSIIFVIYVLFIR